MPTEKLTIEDHHVRNAAYKAETEGFPKGITIYSDQKETGLRLQMEGRTASWVVRFRNSSITIGYVYPENERHITALSKVRELARAVRAMLADNEDDKDRIKAFLAIYYTKGKANRDTKKTAIELHSREEAARRAAEEEASRPTTWTLRECVEETIRAKTDPATRETDRITANTVKDYRLTFNRPAFAHLMDVPVVSITRGDIEAVRDEVKRTVGKSPAGAMKVVIYFRAVMTWCAQNNSRNSGLEGDAWWNMITAPYEIKPRDRRPEIEAIVKTLILAEQYLGKPLPGRAQTVAGVGHGTLSGLWWLVLTCQRANAGMSMLGHDVVDDKVEGWKLAAWSKDVMKAGKAHALPIPSEAWEMVDKFRQKGKHGANTQEWAFPSERKKGKVHVSASGVYRVLYRLAGRDELLQDVERERKKAIPRRTERRDLLEEAGIDWWSLHDLRRAITKALNEAGIPGGASVILAHEVHEKEAMAVTATERQRADFLRLRQAKVTAMTYGGAQHLGLKKEAMKIWCDAVLGEYARQKGLAMSEQAAA
ncbi:tyrosine-type recombinase/integrase [Agrobacterium sp. S2]|nr:tyrosine-type recombinase/integrase [Agrobacterium sp. S2]